MIAVNGLALDVGDFTCRAPALTIESGDCQTLSGNGSFPIVGLEYNDRALGGRINLNEAVVAVESEFRTYLRPRRAASRIDIERSVIGVIRKFGAVVVSGVDLAVGIGRNVELRSVDQRILRVVGELRAGGHVRAVERSNHTGLHLIGIHARDEEVRGVVLRGDAHGELAVHQTVVVVDSHFGPNLLEDLAHADRIAGRNVGRFVADDVVDGVGEVVGRLAADLLGRAHIDLVALRRGEACDERRLVDLLGQTDDHILAHRSDIILRQRRIILGIKAIGQQLGLTLSGRSVTAVIRIAVGAAPSDRHASRDGDPSK